MRAQSDRWSFSASRATHVWKAVTQQHHRELLPLFRRLVPRDGIVLDVGAHAGQFAKLFARCAPAGRVYAVEPSGYTRSILRIVVRLRRLANVTVVPAALGAETREVRLSTPIKASGARGFGLAHLGEPDARWSRVAVELVEETTLDELAVRLALSRLDFIKADIEGSEMRLLTGARRTIERFRPRLMLELNDAHLARAGDTVADAFALTAALGYRAFVMRPDGRLVPAESGAAGDFWFLPAGDPVIATLTETR
jgi:FkbM family methyltransferase